MNTESKNLPSQAWLSRELVKVRASRENGKLAKKRTKHRVIDTFAGAGGMTLGFSPRFGHGFKPVWANDNNDCCVDTYNANFGNHCIGGDIVEILKDKSIKIPQADLVIGGPPCQGFSLLNKKRLNDSRKQLWRPYFEIIERSKASVFVMENVPQLLGSSEYDEILDTAETMGFKVTSAVLCAADYGVSQTRRRAIILGCKDFDPSLVFPPIRTHHSPKLDDIHTDLFENGYIKNSSLWPSVRDAIEDLPPPVGTEIRQEKPPLNLHFGRNPTEKSLARYKAIPKEGMNRFDLQRVAPEITPDCWINKKSGGTDLFGRLWWDRPAFTIRTEFFKPEKGRYLHPKQHRPITPREAARLQSFPDDFQFKGSKIEIAKQIGNAVPPLLAMHIADVVHLLLSMKKIEN